MDFPKRLTCNFCLRKIEIGDKKGRVQNPTFRLTSKSSKCEQLWSGNYANKPNIADGQVELHVFSCRHVKVEPRFQLNIVDYNHDRNK